MCDENTGSFWTLSQLKTCPTAAQGSLHAYCLTHLTHVGYNSLAQVSNNTPEFKEAFCKTGVKLVPAPLRDVPSDMLNDIKKGKHDVELPIFTVGLMPNSPFLTADQFSEITSLQLDKIGKKWFVEDMARKKVLELNGICEESLCYKLGGMDCVGMKIVFTYKEPSM